MRVTLMLKKLYCPLHCTLKSLALPCKVAHKEPVYIGGHAQA